MNDFRFEKGAVIKAILTFTNEIKEGKEYKVLKYDVEQDTVIIQNDSGKEQEFSADYFI